MPGLRKETRQVDREHSQTDAADTKAAVDFGALLRQYRLAGGLTQETLAERAGLSPRSIQHLERGETRPYRETVRRLVQALRLAGEQRTRLEAVVPSAPRRRDPQGPVHRRSPLWAIPLAPLPSLRHCRCLTICQCS
jgi:transcriptional regulator with XRE-family HTH domain